MADETDDTREPAASEPAAKAEGRQAGQNVEGVGMTDGNVGYIELTDAIKTALAQVGRIIT